MIAAERAPGNKPVGCARVLLLSQGPSGQVLVVYTTECNRAAGPWLQSAIARAQLSENAGAVTGGQQRSLMRIHLIESGDGIEDHLDRAFIAATSGKPGKRYGPKGTARRC